jgi:hypothetical protein
MSMMSVQTRLNTVESLQISLMYSLVTECFRIQNVTQKISVTCVRFEVLMAVKMNNVDNSDLISDTSLHGNDILESPGSHLINLL